MFRVFDYPWSQCLYPIFVRYKIVQCCWVCSLWHNNAGSFIFWRLLFLFLKVAHLYSEGLLFCILKGAFFTLEGLLFLFWKGVFFILEELIFCILKGVFFVLKNALFILKDYSFYYVMSIKYGMFYGLSLMCCSPAPMVLMLRTCRADGKLQLCGRANTL